MYSTIHQEQLGEDKNWRTTFWQYIGEQKKTGDELRKSLVSSSDLNQRLNKKPSCPIDTLEAGENPQMSQRTSQSPPRPSVVNNSPKLGKKLHTSKCKAAHKEKEYAKLEKKEKSDAQTEGNIINVKVIKPGNSLCFRCKKVVVEKPMESVVPNSDDYLFCDECAANHLGDCPVHGPLVPIHDTQLPPGYHEIDRAVRTMPVEFELRASGIQRAGLGVWTKVKVNRRIVFDPYEGIERLESDDADKTYSWTICTEGEPMTRIDGSNTAYSNWLRFINCARNKEEENIFPYQYKKKLYYRTIRDIPANEELLVYYGDLYAEFLHIDTALYHKDEGNPVDELPEDESTETAKIN